MALSVNEHNPFIRVKVRSLLVWGAASIPVAALAAVALEASYALDFEDPAVISIAINAWLYGSILLWVVWQVARHRVDIRRILGVVPKGYRWLPTMGLLLALALFSLGSVGTVLYYASLTFPELVAAFLEQELFDDLSTSANPAVYLFALVVSLVLVAPVVEEVLFRGILLHRWTVKWGLGRAAVASSFLFGIGHDFDFFGAFVFGLAMALLYVKTRTLIVPIACHVLHNGVIVVWVLTERGVRGVLGETGPPASMPLEELQSDFGFALLLVALSLPWVAYFAYRNWPRPPTRAPYFAQA